MSLPVIQVYRPKALIPGEQIGQDPQTLWVAVPDKLAGRQIEVEYGRMKMLIKDWRTEAQLFKRFRDKFWTAESKRPQYYTLGYFKWVPKI